MQDEANTSKGNPDIWLDSQVIQVITTGEMPAGIPTTQRERKEQEDATLPMKS
jgi:hypothetical protein